MLLSLLGLLINLLIPVALVVVVVLVIRKNTSGTPGGSSDGHTVRRVFQFLVLYGLFVVLASGLSGLLGRLLETELLVTGDDVALARDLAFTVVGGPLFLGLAWWTRRAFAGRAEEARSMPWAVYVTLASLTALIVTMVELHQVLGWAVGLEEYDGRSVARTLVFGAWWGAHWWVDARTTPRERTRAHHLLGSLIGLAVAATGLGGLLAGALRVLFGLEGDAVLASGGSPILRGLVTLAVGAPVWLVYWARTASREERGPVWFVYVLLAGVGGGLVTAIFTSSTLLYTVLVWLLGDPRYPEWREHFDTAPAAAAAAAAGALVWWYHREVLGPEDVNARTEVRRVYEYLMVALSLLATAGGLILIVAALVEVAAGTAFAGGAPVNTLLAAVTLIVVGGPVWWWHWRMAQSATVQAPAEEVGSPTRRLFLFVLLGVGGVAAVVTLIVGVYLLFQDVVAGTLATETLRRMRFAIGVLLTAAAVATYHWSVFRGDREQVPGAVAGRGPRFVLLVGPADHEIARHLARQTHGRVQAWARPDDGSGSWSVEDVMTALGGTTAEEVVVLHEPDGLRVIPVRRS